GNPAVVAEPVTEPWGTRPQRLAVCHIVSGDRWAGAEVQVATLLRAMAGRNGLRVAAIVLNEGRLADELQTAGVEVRVIPESRNGFFQIYRQAASFLREHPADVLHSHRYKEDILAAVLA